MKKFPKGFLFGSATSAHQIEGHLNNDWARWEKTPGHISDGSTSQVGADSWNHWRDDIKLLKESGQNSYRFSIEWSRVEPEEGVFNTAAIRHYRQLIDALTKNNITPMVTLFHFTCPLWIDNIGGWTNRKTAWYFARFAGKMAEEFGSKVELWSVINEPTVYVNTGYLEARWYPGGKRAYFAGVKAFLNLVSAHKQAYTSMKKANTRVKVGIAMNMSAIAPRRDNFCDRFLVGFAKWFINRYFINCIRNQLDFLGINFYSSLILSCRKPYLGGTLPDGLSQVIIESQRYNLPIYITENGIGTDDDRDRELFIKHSFDQLFKALSAGVDLRGYFHWSLIDNFEWASGYSIKFGLHDINRNPKGSAFIYEELIKKLKN